MALNDPMPGTYDPRPAMEEASVDPSTPCQAAMLSSQREVNGVRIYYCEAVGKTFAIWGEYIDVEMLAVSCKNNCPAIQDAPNPEKLKTKQALAEAPTSDAEHILTQTALAT